MTADPASPSQPAQPGSGWTKPYDEPAPMAAIRAMSLVIGVALGAAAAGVAAVHIAGGGLTADAAWFVTGGVVVSVVMRRGSRIGVYISERGVKIVRPWRTHIFQWPDVAGAEVEPTVAPVNASGVPARLYSYLIVELTDGRELRVVELNSAAPLLISETQLFDAADAITAEAARRNP